MLYVLQLALIGLCLALFPLSYVWVRTDQGKFRKLVWVTTFMTLDLVMFGGFTRLTDSGLGCPDWPGCYGTASPFVAHAAIAAAHAAMPTGPVSMGKAWIEMIHRYFAMAIGVLIIAQTAIAWHARWKQGRAKQGRTGRNSLGVSPWWPTGLLLLIVLQGAFGAWTVTLKLQPVIVTTHLLLGLSLLGGLGLLAARLTPRAAPEPGLAAYRGAALLSLLLLIVQISLGGWVSTNYAVLACTDFPTCNGAWLPPMDFRSGFQLWRALGMNGAGGAITQDALVAIHWTHRTFAFVVIAYLATFAWRVRRFGSVKRPAQLLLLVIALQFVTGLTNILLQWPLPVAVAHNGGAAVLLLLDIVLNFRILSNSSGRAAPAVPSAPPAASVP